MKEMKKQFGKKLTLTKITISNLDANTQGKIYGGAPSVEYHGCPGASINCDTLLTCGTCGHNTCDTCYWSCGPFCIE